MHCGDRARLTVSSYNAPGVDKHVGGLRMLAFRAEEAALNCLTFSMDSDFHRRSFALRTRSSPLPRTSEDAIAGALALQSSSSHRLRRQSIVVFPY